MKPYLEIGEKSEFAKVRYVCVEADGPAHCDECDLRNSNLCWVMQCTPKERRDRKWVLFKKKCTVHYRNKPRKK